MRSFAYATCCLFAFLIRNSLSEESVLDATSLFQSNNVDFSSSSLNTAGSIMLPDLDHVQLTDLDQWDLASNEAEDIEPLNSDPLLLPPLLLPPAAAVAADDINTCPPTSGVQKRNDATTCGAPFLELPSLDSLERKINGPVDSLDEHEQGELIFPDEDDDPSPIPRLGRDEEQCSRDRPFYLCCVCDPAFFGQFCQACEAG